MLKMMRVEDFGLILDMRGCLLSIIDVEYLGMMKALPSKFNGAIVRKAIW